MENSGKSVRSQQSGQLSDQDVSQLRPTDGGHDQSVPSISGGDVQALIQTHLQDKADQELREARSQVEAGRAYLKRTTGIVAQDDKSARVFAHFDAREREPQPAEFYSFYSATLRKYGRF